MFGRLQASRRHPVWILAFLLRPSARTSRIRFYANTSFFFSPPPFSFDEAEIEGLPASRVNSLNWKIRRSPPPPPLPPAQRRVEKEACSLSDVDTVPRYNFSEVTGRLRMSPPLFPPSVGRYRPAQPPLFFPWPSPNRRLRRDRLSLALSLTVGHLVITPFCGFSFLPPPLRVPGPVEKNQYLALEANWIPDGTGACAFPFSVSRSTMTFYLRYERFLFFFLLPSQIDQVDQALEPGSRLTLSNSTTNQFESDGAALKELGCELPPFSLCAAHCV